MFKALGNAGEEANTSVSAVSLKLPPFWPEDAELWFIQAESQFAIRGISQDDTRFHYVVGALDQASAKRCKDILRSPPTSEKYQALKNALLRTFELTEYERASRILHMPVLGDGSPSKLMDDMLDLLGHHSPGLLFRTAFLERLPVDIRTQIIGMKITDARKLGQVANDLWVARTGMEVDGIKQSMKNDSSSLNQAKKAKAPDMKICRYHAAFGKDARQCIEPCRWGSKGKRLSENELTDRN